MMFHLAVFEATVEALRAGRDAALSLKLLFLLAHKITEPIVTQRTRRAIPAINEAGDTSLGGRSGSGSSPGLTGSTGGVSFSSVIGGTIFTASSWRISIWAVLEAHGAYPTEFLVPNSSMIGLSSNTVK